MIVLKMSPGSCGSEDEDGKGRKQWQWAGERVAGRPLLEVRVYLVRSLFPFLALHLVSREVKANADTAGSLFCAS